MSSETATVREGFSLVMGCLGSICMNRIRKKIVKRRYLALICELLENEGVI